MVTEGQYPTMEQAEKASRFQLGRWSRFLPSPGQGAIDTDHFEESMAGEKIVMDRILERFGEGGGWSPGLSKEIGWG